MLRDCESRVKAGLDSFFPQTRRDEQFYARLDDESVVTTSTLEDQRLRVARGPGPAFRGPAFSDVPHARRCRW